MLLWATEHLWGSRDQGELGLERGGREGGGGWEKDIVVVVVVCSSYESLNMLT